MPEEWKVCHESGGGTIYRTEAEARAKFDSFVERPPGVEDPGSGRLTHIAHRYVTAWEPLERCGMIWRE